jgi:acyl carrier protein
LNTKDVLKDYLNTELLNTHSSPNVSEGDNLLTGGLIDSLGMMRLVDFIEQHFDLRVRPEDVTIEHFKTINTIATYINHRNGVEVDS